MRGIFDILGHTDRINLQKQRYGTHMSHSSIKGYLFGMPEDIADPIASILEPGLHSQVGGDCARYFTKSCMLRLRKIRI